MSNNLPGGRLFFYGLFKDNDQIGFMCFANYVPKKKNKPWVYHSNRVVIHPDYVGMGLGIKFVDKCCELLLKDNSSFEIFATFSSIPMLKARLKNKNWQFRKKERRLKYDSRALSQGIGKNLFGPEKSGFRKSVTMYSFKWVGNNI